MKTFISLLFRNISKLNNGTVSIETTSIPVLQTGYTADVCQIICIVNSLLFIICSIEALYYSG